MMFAGVDPGLDGAIAFFRPRDRWLSVFAMPTVDVIRNKKQKREIDCKAVSAIFRQHAPFCDLAAVEGVSGIAGQSAGSSFVFGQATGIVLGALGHYAMPVLRPAPAVWKRAMGVTADKRSSLAKASLLFPQHSGLWTRLKDDGIAEAALLAYWASTWGVKIHKEVE